MSDLEKVQLELATMQSESDLGNVQLQLATMRSDNSKLKDLILEKNNKISYLDMKCTKREFDINRLNTKIDELTAKLEALQTRINDAQSVLDGDDLTYRNIENFVNVSGKLINTVLYPFVEKN